MADQNESSLESIMISNSNSNNTQWKLVDISTVTSKPYLEPTITCPSKKVPALKVTSLCDGSSAKPPALEVPPSYCEDNGHHDPDVDEVLDQLLARGRDSFLSDATSVETPLSVISTELGRGKRRAGSESSCDDGLSATSYSPKKCPSPSTTVGYNSGSDSEGDYYNDNETRIKRSKPDRIPKEEVKKALLANDDDKLFEYVQNVEVGIRQESKLTSKTVLTACDSDLTSDMMNIFSSPTENQLSSVPAPSTSSSTSFVVPSLPTSVPNFLVKLLPSLTKAPKEPLLVPNMSFRVTKTLHEVFDILQSYLDKTKDLNYDRSFYQYMITSSQKGSSSTEQYCRFRLQIYTSCVSDCNGSSEDGQDPAEEHTIVIESEDGNRYLVKDIFEEIKDEFFGPITSYGFDFNDFDSHRVDVLTNQTANNGFGFVF